MPRQHVGAARRSGHPCTTQGSHLHNQSSRSSCRAAALLKKCEAVHPRSVGMTMRNARSCGATISAAPSLSASTMASSCRLCAINASRLMPCWRWRSHLRNAACWSAKSGGRESYWESGVNSGTRTRLSSPSRLSVQSRATARHQAQTAVTVWHLRAGVAVAAAACASEWSASVQRRRGVAVEPVLGRQKAEDAGEHLAGGGAQRAGLHRRLLRHRGGNWQCDGCRETPQRQGRCLFHRAELAESHSQALVSRSPYRSLSYTSRVLCRSAAASRHASDASIPPVRLRPQQPLPAPTLIATTHSRCVSSRRPAPSTPWCRRSRTFFKAPQTRHPTPPPHHAAVRSPCAAPA